MAFLRHSLHLLFWLAGGAKSGKNGERLTDMKSRAKSMLALREKGIDAVFSLLDGLLPPLVASGASAKSSTLLCTAQALTSCSAHLSLGPLYAALPACGKAWHAARHAHELVTAQSAQSYTSCTAMIHQNSMCSCEGLGLSAHGAFHLRWLRVMMCWQMRRRRTRARRS